VLTVLGCPGQRRRRLVELGRAGDERLGAGRSLDGRHEVVGHDLRVDRGISGDAKMFAALAMVIALGWRLFGNTALFAAGLDGSHPERYDDQIGTYLEHLARAATQRPPEMSRLPSEAPPRPSGRQRGS
jgi:hypothetical protein